MIDSCYLGDVRDGLRSFIAAGVRAQTCITSPPYWGLRDYGMTGQMGLEPTPAEYVANMVEVFGLVRNVLADDGTLWLNLGDCYATRAGKVGNAPGGGAQGAGWADRGAMTSPNRMPIEGLKPKDLVGIPWRVAFALQADGWFLRSDVIWHKPNPMPESVTDRPTKAHEYLFLLAKQERYFYDAAAIAEPATDPQTLIGKRQAQRVTGAGFETRGGLLDQAPRTDRNRRTVWTVATQPYSEAHFATFPTALVEPCILAGTSARGHCPACGKGWSRVTESDKDFESGSGRSGNAIAGKHGERMQGGGDTGDIRKGPTISTRTTGWQPTCECGGDPVPGVVLDPFMGSGTVAQVAQDLGRKWIGCELNADYHALQTMRARQSGLVLAAAD